MLTNLSKVIDLFSIEELVAIGDSVVSMLQAFTGKKFCLLVVQYKLLRSIGCLKNILSFLEMPTIIHS